MSSNLTDDWRQQAITWANVDIVPCRHMTSPGHIELTHNGGLVKPYDDVGLGHYWLR